MDAAVVLELHREAQVLGEFGGEGKYDLELSDDRFAKIQRDTKKKIANAGFSLKPALMVQFEPDV